MTRTTHCAEAPKRGRLAWIAGGLLAATAVAVALGSTSGTLALWNDSTPIPAATITVGVGTDLSIAAGANPAPLGQKTTQVPAATWATMLPGDVVGTQITVSNRGDRSADLQAAIDAQSAASPYAHFYLYEGTCPAPLTSPAHIVGSQLGGSPISVVAAPLAPDASKTFCLQAHMDVSVPAASAGTTILPSFSLTITG